MRDAWLAIPLTAFLYLIRLMFITISLCFESYQFLKSLDFQLFGAWQERKANPTQKTVGPGSGGGDASGIGPEQTLGKRVKQVVA